MQLGWVKQCNIFPPFFCQYNVKFDFSNKTKIKKDKNICHEKIHTLRFHSCFYQIKQYFTLWKFFQKWNSSTYMKRNIKNGKKVKCHIALNTIFLVEKETFLSCFISMIWRSRGLEGDHFGNPRTICVIKQPLVGKVTKLFRYASKWFFKSVMCIPDYFSYLTKRFG